MEHGGERVGALVVDEDREQLRPDIVCASLGTRGDLSSSGQRLFAALRELDEQQVDTILVADLGREGLGAALWDRLLRAAEGQVLDIDADSATES